MDLEDLSKTQIILLTLLVSFVTSIATGIVTVTLMDQAPPAVTQTINRVVERTVERVVPPDPGELASTEPTVIEKETTVVVKEDDLITESIDQSKNQIVRLVRKVTLTPEITQENSTTTEPVVESEYEFFGIGVIVSSEGLIATSPSFADVEGLIAITVRDVEHTLEVVGIDENIALLRVTYDEGESTTSFNAAAMTDPASVKLGQTVIAIGGEDRTSISMGIVSSILDTTVSTNISNIVAGEPLINIFGEVVGIDTLEGNLGMYLSSTELETSINALQQAGVEETAVETTEEVETIAL